MFFPTENAKNITSRWTEWMFCVRSSLSYMQSPLLPLGGVDFCPHSRLFHSQMSDFSFKWLWPFLKTKCSRVLGSLTSAALTCEEKLHPSSGFLFCWTRRFMFRVSSSVRWTHKRINRWNHSENLPGQRRGSVCAVWEAKPRANQCSGHELLRINSPTWSY